jgi:glycosyltransferase involved in cell wall biosynthesis
VPIAFDNFSAIYDVVTDGENGYVIKDNNLQDFANKLSGLMGDDDLRRQMAFASVENSRRYHVSNIVDQWENMLTAKTNINTVNLSKA